MKTLREVLRLDEISKNLARRYAVASAGEQSRLNDKAIMVGNSKVTRHTERELDHLQRRFDKRARGLEMANRRLPGGRVEPKL